VKTIILILILSLAGCSYSSRNLIMIEGKDLKFKYGFLGVEGANRLMLLREMTTGDAEPLPMFDYEPLRINVVEKVENEELTNN